MGDCLRLNWHGCADDIDRCLGWAEPTHGNSPNQRLASKILINLDLGVRVPKALFRKTEADRRQAKPSFPEISPFTPSVLFAVATVHKYRSTPRIPTIIHFPVPVPVLPIYSQAGLGAKFRFLLQSISIVSPGRCNGVRRRTEKRKREHPA
jgi:hypothetical protein